MAYISNIQYILDYLGFDLPFWQMKCVSTTWVKRVSTLVSDHFETANCPFGIPMPLYFDLALEGLSIDYEELSRVDR